MIDELEIDISVATFAGVFLLAAIAAHLLGYQSVAKAAFWLGIIIIAATVLIVLGVLIIAVLAAFK